MTNATIKAGDILVSKWGYEQTNVTYYYVVKATAKTVTVQRMEAVKRSDGPKSMTGVSVPRFVIKGADMLPALDQREKPIRRKIQQSYGDTYIKIEDYMYAQPWDHTAQQFTAYA